MTQSRNSVTTQAATSRLRRTLLSVAALAPFLGACAMAKPEPSSRSVTIVAFNYTNRYVADISVNGVWAGGANAFSGGGGAEGLTAPMQATAPIVLRVQWRLSGLYNIESNTYTRLPSTSHEAEVTVAMPAPYNPRMLVLHFYPDGRVEAELEAHNPRRRIPPPQGYHG